MSMFIIWEKSVPKTKDESMKRKPTCVLDTIRRCFQSLILIITLFCHILCPDLKDKTSLENLQWSIDPGADLSQYKMDVTVIDTKVNYLLHQVSMFHNIGKKSL